MKGRGLIPAAVLGALALGIFTIAGAWSAITPKSVAVAPETVDAPNPDPRADVITPLPRASPRTG